MLALALVLASCGGAAPPRARHGTAPAPAPSAEPAAPSDPVPPVDPAEAPAPAPPGHVLEGMATWYGPGFAGHRTANGERFDPSQLTAAHRTLPFGTRVRVISERTGESVVVRINDRGPFGHEERIIDLARGAARRIGLDRAGVMRVRLEIVSAP